jgi:hypothetical protein
MDACENIHQPGPGLTGQITSTILYTAIAKHMPAESRLNVQRYDLRIQCLQPADVIEFLRHSDCVSSCQEGVNYNNGTRVHGTYST